MNLIQWLEIATSALCGVSIVLGTIGILLTMLSSRISRQEEDARAKEAQP